MDQDLDNIIRCTLGEEPTVYRGFTQSELEEAFRWVAPAENWKYPISAHCLKRQREVVEAAIIFFTGSVPTFVETKINPDALSVKAAGYYAAVGA